LISHYDIRFLKPLDDNLLHEIFKNHEFIITVEDGVKKGGLGSAVVEFASEHHYQNQIKILGIPDTFPEHCTVAQLQELAGISASKIELEIKKFL
jgi:1-deoxy-D-xylulose-5-phosphate synthase